MGIRALTGCEALRLNVCATYMALGSNAPGAIIHRGEDFWSCVCPLAHSIANFATHFNLSGEGVQQVIEMARTAPYFRMYLTPGDSPPDINKRLEYAGFTERYRLIGMELQGDTMPGEKLLVRVESRPSLTFITEFMIETFFWTTPRSFREPLSKVLEASSNSGQEFYVCEDSHGVLAGATLSVTGDVAGLYNVCVRPEKRGRGIGSAVVRQLACEARDRNLRLVLQCEPGLANWYKHLSFGVIGELVAYST